MPDWYKKTFFIPFFILLITISIALAVPPETQTFTGSTGFEVEVPPITYLEQNKDFNFHSHVYNLTGGKPIISGITCYLHLYNDAGKHIAKLEDNTVNHNFDYSFKVDGTNFSGVGYYAYIVTCNSSTEGGFIATPLEVTETGLINPIQNTEEELLLYFVFALAIILLIIAFYKDDHNLAAISGMILIVLGGYVIVQGFSTFSNALSITIGIVLIAVGFYIFLRSSIENF